MFQRDIRVCLIQLDQHVTLVYQVTVIGADTDHGARDLRRDLHDVAVDISVVSTFVPATCQDVPDTKNDGGHEDNCPQDA